MATLTIEDDSRQQHQLESPRSPEKGMESVLATVSGYHGSQRFNLIKLIAGTGASYVGNMNQSVTHVVCWKFEGRKYEFAKKLKIPIVNHCWIEECVRKGRRVSEDPYTSQSGEEMGPLVLDIMLGINCAKAPSKDLKIAKGPVDDTEFEDINNASWMNSILLDENLFPQPMQNSRSNRSIGKSIKKTSRTDCPSSSKLLSEPKIVELKEASTSQAAYSCRLPRKRSSTSSEPKSKGRRLVKKHITMKDCISTPNVEEECEEVQVLPENTSNRVLFDSADVGRHQHVSNRHTSDTRCFLSGQDDTDAHDDVEEIEHVSDEDQNTHAQDVLSSPSKELHDAANIDSTKNNPIDKLPASSELSCVICWTDFSSTRGVLPCGHRFCFTCIEKWGEVLESKGKPRTCPLCKAIFTCITRVDAAVSSDQKIYSQSIPNDSSKMDLFFLPDEIYGPPSSLLAAASVCCQCSSREPEDLLNRCQFCEIRCVHSYCLDPPLFPWTCADCHTLQMVYHHSR